MIMQYSWSINSIPIVSLVFLMINNSQEKMGGGGVDTILCLDFRISLFFLTYLNIKLNYKNNIRVFLHIILTMSINYKIVSIEGNIGSGKSTLLENIRNFYDNNTNVIFLREPVDDWEQIKDNEGNTMLKLFYANQEKYSFAFQMMAYISRLKILRDTIKKIQYENKEDYKKEYVIITERSLYTDREVFAKMLYNQGKIEIQHSTPAYTLCV